MQSQAVQFLSPPDGHVLTLSLPAVQSVGPSSTGLDSSSTPLTASHMLLKESERLSLIQ